MNKKMSEMIALGVSYALNCHPCLDFHRDEAERAGLSPEEMGEAIGIAEQVVRGARNRTTTKVASMLGDFGPTVTEECCPAGSDCCS